MWERQGELLAVKTRDLNLAQHSTAQSACSARVTGAKFHAPALFIASLGVMQWGSGRVNPKGVRVHDVNQYAHSHAASGAEAAAASQVHQETQLPPWMIRPVGALCPSALHSSQPINCSSQAPRRPAGGPLPLVAPAVAPSDGRSSLRQSPPAGTAWRSPDGAPGRGAAPHQCSPWGAGAAAKVCTACGGMEQLPPYAYIRKALPVSAGDHPWLTKRCLNGCCVCLSG